MWHKFSSGFYLLHLHHIWPVSCRTFKINTSSSLKCMTFSCLLTISSLRYSCTRGSSFKTYVFNCISQGIYYKPAWKIIIWILLHNYLIINYADKVGIGRIHRVSQKCKKFKKSSSTRLFWLFGHKHLWN